MSALFLTDGYKLGHHKQYPEGTTLVYSNFTPRSAKHAPEGCDAVVSFGQQFLLCQLDGAFRHEFFKLDKSTVCQEAKEMFSGYLGIDYDVSHFEALHDLGYLPICIKGIEEGTLVPFKVPVLTIYNTHPDFFWLPNFLETFISNILWKPITSATIAYQYKKLLTKWALKTDEGNVGFVDYQAHDFSMRGLNSMVSTMLSGLGHLTSFKGTDSLTTLRTARDIYDCKEMVGFSVNATEHSVMCAGGEENELETFRRLIATHPTGILSIVSDTWDLWKVLTEYLPLLKDEIMARDGKIVIRPDSGDPEDIICGSDWQWDPPLTEEDPQYKGVIELLWNIFGGTINAQGYKVLDSHIGAIYGDSITLEVADDICTRLEVKGFASTNVVFGIGSFTYQYNTRDTLGLAMKATYVEINGEGRAIFKDPITDGGVKKSAAGLLSVGKETNGTYYMVDGLTWTGERGGDLKEIYRDGEFLNEITFEKIRENIKGSYHDLR